MLPFHDESVIRENIIAKILFASCSAKFLYREIFRVYGRIYWLDWSGYPSKRLYVKRTGHETHDKIATITGVTLGLQSN